MKNFPIVQVAALFVVVANAISAGAAAPHRIEAKGKHESNFAAHPVRTLADLPAAPVDTDLDEYGGLKSAREEAPDVYKKASPVSYAYQEAQPILILRGTADDTVNVSQSETLAAALKRVGAPHELVVIPGAPHTFHLENVPGRDLRPLVLGFFDKHLKTPRP